MTWKELIAVTFVVGTMSMGTADAALLMPQAILGDSNRVVIANETLAEVKAAIATMGKRMNEGEWY